MNFQQVMGLEVRNTDLVRPSFLDVERVGSSRRQVIEPGQTFDCQIAAGPAAITFGPALDCTFLDLDE